MLNIKEHTNITYIYALCEESCVKYIGKSNNPDTRLKQHIYDSKRNTNNGIVKGTWKEN